MREFWLANLVVLIKNMENEAQESFVVKHVWKDVNVAAIALANSEVDDDGGITELDDVLDILEINLSTDMV